jgi:hypothetical protein
VIDFDNLSAFGEAGVLEAEILRLERLLADLRHVRDYGSPDEVSLRAAPYLDHWSISYRPAQCLVGCTTGHPLLPGADRYIATSDLCLISERENWARTRSRYYRLGGKSNMNPKIVLS